MTTRLWLLLLPGRGARDFSDFSLCYFSAPLGRKKVSPQKNMPGRNKMWIKCHGISQLQRQLKFSIDQSHLCRCLSGCLGPRPNAKTGHFNRPHLRRKFVGHEQQDTKETKSAGRRAETQGNRQIVADILWVQSAQMLPRLL